jgi:hypothetical protein
VKRNPFHAVSWGEEGGPTGKTAIFLYIGISFLNKRRLGEFSRFVPRSSL